MAWLAKIPLFKFDAADFKRQIVSDMPLTNLIKIAIRDVLDFPKQGVVFKDITPVLADPALFRYSIDAIIEPFSGEKIDKIVGIDARGFIFAAAVADRLECGFVPVRKSGKLPWRSISTSYDLEYGKETVEIHEDAISSGEKILLVDDLLATGGTSSAALELISALGGEVVGLSFLVELEHLNGREKLQKYKTHSVVVF